MDIYYYENTGYKNQAWFSVRDPLRGSQCLALFILAYIFPDLKHLHDRSPTYTPNRRTSALLVRKKSLIGDFYQLFAIKGILETHC